jgi:hypothetical protein
MNKRPGCCPHPDCENYYSPGPNFTRKCLGYYTPKSLGHRLATYQCKACGRTFSNRTESDDARQHRPDLNKLLPRSLCSGVTMRRAAWILACSYNTVRARSAWLAERARLAHGEALAAGEHDKRINCKTIARRRPPRPRLPQTDRVIPPSTRMFCPVM